jgi:hypothetical protein
MANHTKILKPWAKPAVKSTLNIKETLGAAMTGPDAQGQKGQPVKS